METIQEFSKEFKEAFNALFMIQKWRNWKSTSLSWNCSLNRLGYSSLIVHSPTVRQALLKTETITLLLNGFLDTTFTKRMWYSAINGKRKIWNSLRVNYETSKDVVWTMTSQGLALHYSYKYMIDFCPWDRAKNTPRTFGSPDKNLPQKEVIKLRQTTHSSQFNS